MHWRRLAEITVAGEFDLDPGGLDLDPGWRDMDLWWRDLDPGRLGLNWSLALGRLFDLAGPGQVEEVTPVLLPEGALRSPLAWDGALVLSVAFLPGALMAELAHLFGTPALQVPLLKLCFSFLCLVKASTSLDL